MANGADSSPFDNHMNVRERRFLKGIFSGSVLFFALCQFVTPRAFSQIIAKTDTTLAGVKSLYDNGSYISAELQARRVLEEKNLSDSARIQLEKYVAFSLVAQGRNDAATGHFKNALEIDSTLTLDPILTSPKILEVFETARSQFKADQEKKRAQQVLDAPPMGRPVLSEAGGPTFRAIFFPGWEQSFRGESLKGHILLGAGGVTAFSSITFFFLRQNARTSYLNAPTPEFAASRYKIYDSFYKAEYYSVSAFLLIYVYSGIDAFVKLPPNFDLDYSASQSTARIRFQIHF